MSNPRQGSPVGAAPAGGAATAKSGQQPPRGQGKAIGPGKVGQAQPPQAQGKQGKAAGEKQWMSVKDAIGNAAKLYANGRMQEAENLCRQIIAARPNLADAHNILAVVLHKQGKTDEGIEFAKKAISLNGESANFYSNLGEMQRQQHQLVEAETALRKAITLDPKSPQAHNNLGIVFYDKREFAKAADAYRLALSLDDNYGEAHNNLGNALRALDKYKEALKEYERAIESKDNYAEAYNNMGTALRDMQKLEEAEFAYRRAVGIKPNYLEALNNLAGLFITQKRYDDALRVLADTLKTHPNDPQTLVSVARAQLLRGNNALAERAAKMALKQEPENAEALCIFGQVCHELDRYDEAIESFKKAVELKPYYIEALNFYGIALKSMGKMEEARAIFVRALEMQPRAIGAYSNLVDLEKFTEDHPMFKAMANIMAHVKDPEDERFTALHFALGKAYDDMGNYEKAFHHFSTGARLKRETLEYKENEVFKFFDDIAATFNKEYFEKRVYEGNPTTLPIFIIGMPRSGSTLTEQIISSHPDVYGAGEIKTLSICLGQLRQKYPNLPRYPEMVTEMRPSQYAFVGDGYLNFIKSVSGEAKKVTDKLLTNYYFAGLIYELYPNAKIIHTMRNPIDTCLSSFTKLYKDDMPHSYDLAELGRYYRKYQQLMDHWRKVLPPGVMYDAQYEDVVADIDNKARQIVEFCGLTWNDKCLEFHRSDRPIKTASVSQVRKPLYKTSVERWRNYGDALLPLINALEGKDTGESATAPATAANAKTTTAKPKPKAKSARR